MGEGDTVSISSRARSGHIEPIVDDTGAGMPRDQLDRVFERFTRTDSGRGRASGGTGLGLAIVKAIAEAHGGHVRAESDCGRGSKFTIALPSSP
jgi:signal transduction histidine kinase